jgi:branched-chain amino acid transport system permease protein
VLATLAALFINPDLGSLGPASYTLALKALPVVVIGGLDSIGGTVVAALLVGLAEALTGTYQVHLTPYIGQNFSQVVPYLVMFVVLLVRPYGLFGTREVERV